MLDGVDQARRLVAELAQAAGARAEFEGSLPAGLRFDDVVDRAAGRPTAPPDPERLAELRREVFRRQDGDGDDESAAVAELRQAEREIAERRERLDRAVVAFLAVLAERAAAAASVPAGVDDVLADDGTRRRPVTAWTGTAPPRRTDTADDPDDDPRRRRPLLLVVAAVVLFAVVAAVAVAAYGQWRDANPVTAPTPTSSREASPTPTGPVTPTPAPTPTPTAEPSCVKLDLAAPGAEEVGGWALQTPVDTGPIEYARGTVEADSAGVPIAYTVASGDIPDFVADRLCLNDQYLAAINSVRRDGIARLYPGDVINLEPHSVLITGTQQGNSLANIQSSTLPPQTQPYVEPAPTNWLPVADTGPNEYAHGEPVLRNGELVGYRVAKEDVLGYVAERFGTTRGQLLELNCPRRNDEQLFEGDIVNLNPATVYTVGARNGKLANKTDCVFSFPLPSQR